MANMTVFNQHFNLLEEVIEKLNLRNKPKSIFSCDESMIAMDRRTGKVVISRNTKQAYCETKGTIHHITLNAYISASGFILPSHIIFQQSFSSGPDGALYSIPPNGYMDLELFYGFLNKLFIPPNKAYQSTKASNT